MVSPQNQTPPEVMRAFIEYLKRQNGISIPSGCVTEEGWWFPDLHENIHACCDNYDLSDLYEHCKSMEHCANYFGAKPQDVQRLVDIYLGREKEDAEKQTAKNSPRMGSYKVWLSEIGHKISRLQGR